MNPCGRYGGYYFTELTKIHKGECLSELSLQSLVICFAIPLNVSCICLYPYRKAELGYEASEKQESLPPKL